MAPASLARLRRKGLGLEDLIVGERSRSASSGNLGGASDAPQGLGNPVVRGGVVVPRESMGLADGGLGELDGVGRDTGRGDAVAIGLVDWRESLGSGGRERY